MSKFTYKEDEFLEKARQYIETTYTKHYVNDENDVQMWDAEDFAEAKGFFRINAKKYIHRYGKKNGFNDEDLLKAIHYICMLRYWQKEKIEKKSLPKNNTTNLG